MGTPSRAGLVLSLTAASALAAMPATAGQEDCAAIGASLGKLAGVPAYRQKIDLGDGSKMETVVVGDGLYMKMDGEWEKTVLPAAKRAELFASVFDSLKVTECASEGEETVGGLAMKVYSYLLPAMPPFLPQPETYRIHLGSDDGLPHLLRGGKSVIEISYDGVTAPDN